MMELEPRRVLHRCYNLEEFIFPRVWHDVRHSLISRSWCSLKGIQIYRVAFEHHFSIIDKAILRYTTGLYLGDNGLLSR